MGTALATCAVGDAHASMHDEIVTGGMGALASHTLGLHVHALATPVVRGRRRGRGWRGREGG